VKHLSTQWKRKPKPITRTVIDPYSTPYDNMSMFGQNIMKAPPKYVTERYIDGKWEFDNLDPRRAGSGGKGTIA
jgi:hypothetical protein